MGRTPVGYNLQGSRLLILISHHSNSNSIWELRSVSKEDHVKFYKVGCQQFVSWSHNIQMLLDDGNRIAIPQGNF